MRVERIISIESRVHSRALHVLVSREYLKVKFDLFISMVNIHAKDTNVAYLIIPYAMKKECVGKVYKDLDRFMFFFLEMKLSV